MWFLPLILAAFNSDTNRFSLTFDDSYSISTIMSYSWLDTSCDLCRPVHDGSMSNFFGGRIFIVIFGKYCVRTLFFSKDSLEYCAPLMRIGKILALAFSATSPAPSYIFIKAPVTLTRRSGKIMTFLFFRIKSTKERKDIGLFKSSGYTSTIRLKKRANHLFSHSGLMTKVIFSGIKAAISSPSSKDV